MIVRSVDGGCTLSVRVQPGAKRNAITGIHNGALRIFLVTSPADGRTNTALIAFLANRLNIPRASIQLVSSGTVRSKTVRLMGLTASEAESRLLTDLA